MSTHKAVGTRHGGEVGAAQDADLDALAAQAGVGDRVALDQFLGLIRAPVVRYCRARLGDGTRSPAEVADDVLLTVCAALPGFLSETSSAAGLVHGIACRSVDEELAHRSGAAARRDLIERLPPSQREVLVLRVVLQYSLAETAHIVGSTPGAVRITQHHALTGLRTLLADTPGLDLVSS